jgi:hypothetical protein
MRCVQLLRVHRALRASLSSLVIREAQSDLAGYEQSTIRNPKGIIAGGHGGYGGLRFTVWRSPFAVRRSGSEVRSSGILNSEFSLLWRSQNIGNTLGLKVTCFRIVGVCKISGIDPGVWGVPKTSNKLGILTSAF